jgi:hypothetical protein
MKIIKEMQHRSFSSEEGRHEALMNTVQKVQVCDATKMIRVNIAGYIKNKSCQ